MAGLQGFPGLGVLSAFGSARSQAQEEGDDQLQKLNAIQGMLSRSQAQQENQQIKGVLSQTGGDPAKAVQALLQTGSPMGIELAAKLKGMMPKPPEDRVVAPGSSIVAADGTVRFTAPTAPKANPTRHRPMQVGNGYFDVTEEMKPDGTWSEIGRKPVKDPTIVMPRQPQMPIQKTDEQGNVTLWDYSGKKIADLGKVGSPNAQFVKNKLAKEKASREIGTVVTELEAITQDGGLIDQSTGSGAGALVDAGARFFGKATPGANAVGKLKPIFDLVLKMVPRFEGPQSDKDTQSYKEASGQLADPNIPNPTKKEAAKEILRLMRQRQGQFSTIDLDDAPAGTDGGGLPSIDAINAELERRKKNK